MPFDCQFRAAHGQDACLLRCPTPGDRPRSSRSRASSAATSVAAHRRLDGGHRAARHAPRLAEPRARCDRPRGPEHRVRPDGGAARGRHARARDVVTTCAAVIAFPSLRATGTASIWDGRAGASRSASERRRRRRLAGHQGRSGVGAALFGLFDAVLADRDAATAGRVPHLRRDVCRWLGIADAVLRGPEKGGKSSGIVDKPADRRRRRAPWFARGSRASCRTPAAEDPGQPALRPAPDRAASPLACRCSRWRRWALGGPAGDGITAVEVLRAIRATSCRVWSRNPSPGDRQPQRQLTILTKRLSSAGRSTASGMPNAQSHDRESFSAIRPRGDPVAAPRVELHCSSDAAAVSISAGGDPPARRRASGAAGRTWTNRSTPILASYAS